MPSYKIHSLKDSNKLSFIIEGESENSVQQKLSSEGYIVLSVEKTEVDTGKIFVFEGKKPDKGFIEGKIEADDIFVAYDMLTKEYHYIVEKLYPSSISDPEEQKRIFQKMLGTFEQKKATTSKAITNTSSKNLQKNKEIIEKLKKALEPENIKNKDLFLADLKKLELINNNATIEESLKNILKDLITHERKRTVFFEKIKPLATEVGVFVVPNVYLVFLQKIQNFFLFLVPLIHPEEYKNTPKETKNINSKQIEKKEHPYIDIHKNIHIHSLLRKKYQQSGFLELTDQYIRQAYLYTSYRSGTYFFFSGQTLSYLGKILRISLVLVLLTLLILHFLGGTKDMFVFNGTIFLFFGIVVLSLVIPSETV